MNERRASPRLRTLKGGLIVYGVAPTVPCVVRNMSERGALLCVAPIGIPDEFTLVIKPEMRKRPCRVVWRSSQQIGVSFV